MFQTTDQVIIYSCLPYEPQLISIHRPFAILYPLFLAKQVSPFFFGTLVARVRSVDSAEDPAYAPALPRDRTRRGSHCLPGTRSSGAFPNATWGWLPLDGWGPRQLCISKGSTRPYNLGKKRCGCLWKWQNSLAYEMFNWKNGKICWCIKVWGYQMCRQTALPSIIGTSTGNSSSILLYIVTKTGNSKTSNCKTEKVLSIMQKTITWLGQSSKTWKYHPVTFW